MIKLDRDNMQRYISDLLEVEQLVHQERGSLYSTELWDGNQFLSELPGKFEISYGVVKKDKLIAFLICSTPFPDMNYVHRVAVHPQYSGRKLGRKLMTKAYLEWKRMPQYNTITAVIRKDHKLSLPFAALLGARIADKPFMTRFFEARGKTDIQVLDDHFVDEHGIAYVLIYINK
jgi:GNAT superfamily N-acetyltransferase